MSGRTIAYLSGPLLFLCTALVPLDWDGFSYPVRYTIGICLWMMAWWMTDAVPMAATSLLPLILFPLCGVMPSKLVSAQYGNEIIFMLIAGFFMGKAIEHWQLHRRIALSLVLRMGQSPARMILGFMLAAGVISMWISNTATCVMMAPVALAACSTRRDDANFAKALMLGVGYACSIGGVGTLIGTPTNAIFTSYMQQKMQITISFGDWLLFGLPYAALLLFACWYLLIAMFGVGRKNASTSMSTEYIQVEHAELGRISTPEKRILMIFGAVVLAWVSGSLWWYDLVPGSSDTVVAICGSLLLFSMPAGTDREEPLLRWELATKIPWSIALLFGGGLALAKGFEDSGLALWLSGHLNHLQGLPYWAIAVVVWAVVVLLSEIASNVATASIMMPILASLALAIGIAPTNLLMTAAMAASLGFGLPIATAANSIVFATGKIPMRDMMRAGFLLDLIGIVLLLAMVSLLGLT